MSTVSFVPRETTEGLVNPGMGWTTFNSFQGDEKNRGYPPTSLAYFRLYWDRLEPEEEQYRWDIIDDLLARAAQCGQDLALRVSAMNGVVNSGETALRQAGLKPRNYRVPDWYRHSGARGQDFVPRGQGTDAVPIWEPDYGDDLFLEKHGRFITALGRRYDGHPHLDHVDIGSIGRWGEWHCAAVPRPTVPQRLRMVDIYRDAFRKTPLLMLIGDEEALAHAVGHGAGWRADCWGDSRQGCFNPDWQGGTEDFNHHDDIYLQRLVGARATKAWKRAPVAFESCWTMRHWYEQGWSVEHIFAFGLALHGSIFNNKSTPVPEEWWPQVHEFSRKMGYRLVPRRMEYPLHVGTDRRLPFRMILENRGVAPCYRDYVPALRLRNPTTRWEAVVPLPLQVRDWLPGRHAVESAVQLPGNLPRGRLELALGIVNPVDGSPKISLAIEGRDAAGWYPLGPLEMRA